MVELVRQTCEKLPRAKQQVTTTASKGSNGRVEQANRAVEGMTRTMMQSLETKYNVEIPTGHPVVQWAILHAARLWETFPTRRGWPDRLLSTEPEKQPKCDFAVCRDRALAGPHMLKLRSKWGYGVWPGRSVASDCHAGLASGVFW